MDRGDLVVRDSRCNRGSKCVAWVCQGDVKLGSGKAGASTHIATSKYTDMMP